MKSKRITEDEIKTLKVAYLPLRPTAPSTNGGLGYTASQMKAAFDKLPLFLVDRVNDLIDDLEELEAKISGEETDSNGEV